MRSVEDVKRAVLEELQKAPNMDKEDAHLRADLALCRLLVELGHGDVVDAWARVDKWYA